MRLADIQVEENQNIQKTGILSLVCLQTIYLRKYDVISGCSSRVQIIYKKRVKNSMEIKTYMNGKEGEKE